MKAWDNSINFCLAFFPKVALALRYINPAAPSVNRMNIMTAHIFLQYRSRKVIESTGRVDLTKYMITFLNCNRYIPRTNKKIMIIPWTRYASSRCVFFEWIISAPGILGLIRILPFEHDFTHSMHMIHWLFLSIVWGTSPTGQPFPASFRITHSLMS